MPSPSIITSSTPPAVAMPKPPAAMSHSQETNGRSLKRPTPSSPSDDEKQDQRKRQRTTSVEMQHPTPESPSPLRTPLAEKAETWQRTPQAQRQESQHKDDAEETNKVEEAIHNHDPSRLRFAPLYPQMQLPTRTGLQQCIALVLQHVGFDSASPEALEEFTAMTETYTAKLASRILEAAHGARRSVPAPVDYELALPEFNLSPWQLKKHLKPPRRLPHMPVLQDVFDSCFPQTALSDLPVFDVLSGEGERSRMPHIPSRFPRFPSIHTYKYTETDAKHAEAIIKGVEVDEAAEQAETRRRVRDQAILEAKQSEEALRRVVRATKVRRQKEASNLAVKGKDLGTKNRYLAWEKVMREYLPATALTQTQGGNQQPGATLELADHSMVVNSERIYARQPVSTKRHNHHHSHHLAGNQVRRSSAGHHNHQHHNHHHYHHHHAHSSPQQRHHPSTTTTTTTTAHGRTNGDVPAPALGATAASSSKSPSVTRAAVSSTAVAAAASAALASTSISASASTSSRPVPAPRPAGKAHS